MASKQSSLDAFSKVDELVSKPVLGSDGASKWQQFRTSGTAAKQQSTGAAPTLVLKHVDRSMGFTSLQQERAVEQETRKKEGHASMGEGYTSFKRKGNSAADAAERKRIKAIRERVRPDHVSYFVASPTFDGWKHDYVFTTRQRGTGYYWDGMDSVKDLDNKTTKNDDAATAETNNNKKENGSVEKKPKKKKKKKRKRDGPEIIEDANNPIEQVANAIQRRQEELRQPPAFLRMGVEPTAAANSSNGGPLNDGWDATKDSSTGKTYYYNRETGETSWKRPVRQVDSTDARQPDTPSTVSDDKKDKPSLPPGWKTAKDPNSQKEYYYHTDGKTSWERPKS